MFFKKNKGSVGKIFFIFFYQYQHELKYGATNPIATNVSWLCLVAENTRPTLN